MLLKKLFSVIGEIRKDIEGIPDLIPDDKKKVIKFKNSWSNKWGQKGYGFLPYAYIGYYMMDAWSSVDVDDPSPLTLASVLSYRERTLV